MNTNFSNANLKYLDSLFSLFPVFDFLKLLYQTRIALENIANIWKCLTTQILLEFSTSNRPSKGQILTFYRNPFLVYFLHELRDEQTAHVGYTKPKQQSDSLKSTITTKVTQPTQSLKPLPLKNYQTKPTTTAP